MAKLTEKSIAALDCPPGRKDRLVFDEGLPGLAVRVSANGKKAFLAQYTAAGKRHRVPLGRWGALTLEQARSAARGILGKVAHGHNPAEQRTAARVAAVAASKADRLKLDVLLTEWGELSLGKRRESYRREALRAVRFAFADYLAKPAGSLMRADTVKVLDAIVQAGHGSIAGRTLAYGRACYGWALRRGMVETNPFNDLPIAAGVEARDRVLTDAEVQLVWQATAGFGWPFGPLFQLLLLTAQRRSEVGGMRWSELSDERTIWVIPSERAKNGRAHIVHLAPAARDIITGLPLHAGSDLVFTTTGKTPVSGFGKAKVELDAAIGRLNGKAIPSWRLHDFRRTAVTWMAGNGVAPHVADRLLNHVTGAIQGVAAVYQRAEFLVERKAALEAWGEKVSRRVGTVVDLPTLRRE